MKMRLNQIDGLRFWACMVIVADHARVLGLRFQGGIMVSLFFVLSGFFIAGPLKPDGEDSFLSLKGWGSFYITRIVRIIPVYWFSLFLVSWLFINSFTGKRLLMNMFFIEGWGHLWFLTHEMLCYILAPAVMMVIALLKKHLKIRNIWISVGLFLLSVLLHIYLYNITTFRVLNQPLRFDLFVLGISFSYLYKSGVLQTIHKKSVSLAADFFSILIILAVHFTGSRVLARFNPALSEYSIGWARPWLCGFIGGILILLIILNSKGIVSRIFSFPWFVRIGKASYGIYILHYYYFIMDPQPFATPMRNFIANVLVSCCIALIFFEWIEEPLYRFVKKMLNGSFSHKKVSA